MDRFDRVPDVRRQLPRVYCICSFQGGAVVPTVELIDAETDEEAVGIARRRNLVATREIWERHRLIARIPALRAQSETARSPLVSE